MDLDLYYWVNMSNISNQNKGKRNKMKGTKKRNQNLVKLE